MITFLICIFFCFISEMLTYKFIRRIDKKERKKLQLWEDEFVNTMKPQMDEINKKYLEFLKNKEKTQIKKEKEEKE